MVSIDLQKCATLFFFLYLYGMKKDYSKLIAWSIIGLITVAIWTTSYSVLYEIL